MAQLTTKLIKNALVLLPLTLHFSHVLADETDNWGPNYTPPKTPALHEPSELDKRNDPTMGKVYLGLIGGFGQARSTEKGSTAGAGYVGGVDVGFIQNTTNFTRYSFGLEGLVGNLGFKDDGTTVDASLNYALIFKGTYGYRLGSSLMGEAKAGIGFGSADFESKNDEVTVKNEEAATGMIYVLGYDVIVPMSTNLELLAGFSWTHYSFDLGKVKATLADGSVFVDTPDGNTLINQPKVELGFRYLL